MRYGKEFFDLQLRFARVVAALAAIPLEQALLDYTNLHVRFGLGRAFDQDHPTWRRYIQGLSQTTHASDWTYSFYLAHAQAGRETPLVATFGCFSYATPDSQSIRLHFQNTDTATVSPLSIDRLPMRLSELRALFDHVRRYEPEAESVLGTSWLYNLRAYQRLFPEAYIASATVPDNRFRNMSLWGQFLDRNGGLKVGFTEDFLRRLSKTTTVRELASCFPLQALAVSAPITQFHTFYDSAM
ncbi:hypothetical protein [Paraburkholderia graminis]|uniref:hypothetical protein n=1 Tax=Paraburkholderia graminis TaxID=60548 RepID=UPI0038BA9D30